MNETITLLDITNNIDDAAYKLEKISAIVMELKEGIFSKNPKPDFSQIEAAEILRDYNHSTLFIQILDDYVDGSQDLLKQISNEVEQISKRFANIKSII